MTVGALSLRPLIEVESASKRFGAVRALESASAGFLPGSVHGLVGANGAGKSTFLNLLAGTISPDSGVIRVDGQPVQITDPRASAALGFAFISQELALVPEFSATDNMTLGSPALSLFGLRDRRGSAGRSAQDVAERLGMRFSLDVPVRSLSVAERGMVAIGRALVGQARFLAMDEPTASLSDVECERVFSAVRELAADGVAIAYVSHRLGEIENLCDVVTVFKDGQIVKRTERGGYTRADLITAIAGTATVGQAIERLPGDVRPGREAVLEVRHLTKPPRVRDVSFTLHRGEILGLGGVVGAGRTETARMVFGADRPAGGTMTLYGASYEPASVRDAVGNGIGLVPEERRSQALVMDDSVLANIVMGNWASARIAPRLPLTSKRVVERQVREISDRLNIKMGSIYSPVRTLSGGNQQKVVFARWFLRDARVLLLDEPTRGVDVSARHQIWQAAEQFAAEGNSVLVICSELAELSVCHRVIVMVEGRDVGELQGPGLTEDQINEAIYSMGRESGLS